MLDTTPQGSDLGMKSQTYTAGKHPDLTAWYSAYLLFDKHEALFFINSCDVAK